jgi:ferredoxin-type protein NapH
MKIRQKIRKGIVLFSFFLFPATFYYFSPYLIIDATTKGIINGSFIIFCLMFISSLVLGRGFCGWVCPGAGCQEAIVLARNKQIRKGDAIKWIIWIPWISIIVILAIRRGGYKEIDFLYQTKHGFSIGDVYGLIIYFVVLLLIVIPAFIVGKRSFCHHICWMAPFMILGRKIRNTFGWPSLQLVAEPEICSHCHKCTYNCPMSLPVEGMVRQNNMENAECILCGNCIDGCKDNVIRYAFKKRCRNR